jgi:hypothetical protein
MILEAIRDVLLADSTVTDSLATHDFGDGGSPAIFTVDPIPETADHPAIILTMAGGIPWGTRAQKGTEIDVDARVYDDKLESSQRIRDIAWRMWEVINRANLSVEGYSEVGVYADPPVQAPDPDGFPGLRVTSTIRILEE